MEKVLIVGGAGYIGSHTNKILNQNGYQTIVYDNLKYGHVEAVQWGDFIKGDLNDTEKIRQVFLENNISAVMHFAAYAYVGESVDKPEKYYKNNVINTINLLQVMREYECPYFIFSSTCATYGNPKYLPIDEKHPQNPINPYGSTKLMVETILKDYSKAYGLKYVSLRYFNAAGADTSSEIGENHTPETHLVPLILDAAMGIREDIKVFGTNYDTRDGSAIRDYIHVNDLAQAHILALKYLQKGGQSEFFNLGNGDGYTVLEVIESVKKITGKQFKVSFVDRRAGDPPSLIGGSDKAIKILGWKPEFASLDVIIKTAWDWHQKMRSG